MANPLIPQGVLNRLIASVFVTDFPELNITSGYLADPGISLSLGGNITTLIPTITGNVSSPEPYQTPSIFIPVLKTNQIGDLWKTQWENDSFLGDVVVTSDSDALSQFTFIDCSIISVREMAFGGKDAALGITIGGTYPINDGLYL